MQDNLIIPEGFHQHPGLKRVIKIQETPLVQVLAEAEADTDKPREEEHLDNHKLVNPVTPPKLPLAVELDITHVRSITLLKTVRDEEIQARLSTTLELPIPCPIKLHG